ncbi:MAG: hypothetical protein LBD38_01695, partial [Streptococcaceae bacterium]|nr:hypothetical protein [Streptococcaceae bacterium]
MANNFQPETKFTLSSLRRVSDLEKESLMMLYQPILGPTAVSLYLTLEGLETRLRGDSISFGELLRTTRLMKSEFVVALDRLEGIGLINTFQRLAIGEGYDFHLNLEPSLSRDEFLKNEPLATLLLIEMGQEYFSLMVDLTKPYEMEGIGFLEVTKSFYEVFGTPISQVHKEDLEKAMRLANPTGRGLNLQTTPFDFRIFRDVLLKETGLQLETEEQEKVLILAATYGLNEFSFVERLKAVVETGDTHIPFDKLREVLEQNENFR